MYVLPPRTSFLWYFSVSEGTEADTIIEVRLLRSLIIARSQNKLIPCRTFVQMMEICDVITMKCQERRSEVKTLILDIFGNPCKFYAIINFHILSSWKGLNHFLT